MADNLLHQCLGVGRKPLRSCQLMCTNPNLSKTKYSTVVEDVKRSSILLSKRLTSNLRGDSKRYHKSDYQVIPFFVVLDRLQDGDVILYRTKRFLSKVQRKFCNSVFDHVGIVVQKDNCSDACCSADLKAQRKAAGYRAWHTLEADSNGVSLYRFTPSSLGSYAGTCFIRRLHIPNQTPMEKAHMLVRLHAFVDQMEGRPYERDLLQMAKAANYFGKNEKEDLSSLFCSELVAAAYREIGLLPKDRPSNSYIPGDFSSLASDRRRVNLLGGATLDKEAIIDTTDMSVPVPNSGTQSTQDAAQHPSEQTNESHRSLLRSPSSLEAWAQSSPSDDHERLLPENHHAELEHDTPSLVMHNVLKQRASLRKLCVSELFDHQNTDRPEPSANKRVLLTRSNADRAPIDLGTFGLTESVLAIQRSETATPQAELMPRDMKPQNISTKMVVIPPGGVHLQLVYVENDHTFIEWDYKLDHDEARSHDIDFDLVGPLPELLNPGAHNDKAAAEYNELLKLYAPVATHKQRNGRQHDLTSGKFCPLTTGWYVLRWSNEFSWLASKKVHFMCCVGDTSDNTVQVDDSLVTLL